MMNEAIATTLATLVRRLTCDVQTLPRELLDQRLREVTEERQRLSDRGKLTEALAALYDDEVARLKLITQWCNQAKEQLATGAEMAEVSQRCRPDLVNIILRRGGPEAK